MTPEDQRRAGLSLPWHVWQHHGGWFARLPWWPLAVYAGDSAAGVVKLLRRLEGEEGERAAT